MEVRFKEKSKIFDVLITVIGGVVSVGTMLYGVWKLGLQGTWPELVLNLFYIACLVMMGMYFFKYRITAMQFNYWCSVCVGATVLLRDILLRPQGVGNIFKAQPVDDLHNRHGDRDTLHHYHCVGTSQRVHRIPAHGNLDPAYHHLWSGGLLCVGSGRKYIGNIRSAMLHLTISLRADKD